MRNLKIISLSLLFLFLHSCSEYSESAEMMEAAAEESAVPDSSTAATYQDEERQFVRTADLSMEVKNVYNSTMRIESKAAQLGGFVTNSQLESRVLSKESFAVSQDSAVEVKKYRVSNQMSLRIPQKELGNFLNSLGEEIEFLHYRNISADDVSLNFALADLENNRLNSTHDKLENVQNKNGKISDNQNVVNNMDRNQSEINHQKVATMKLKDDVAYSSLTLAISEKEKIAETIVINPKTYDDKFRPGFWYRAGISVQDGFYFFQSVLVAALYIWPLWLTGIILFFFIKFQFKKTV